MDKIRITAVPGIGRKLQEDFKNLGIYTIDDILQLAPRAYDDRREERCLSDISIEDPNIACRIFVKKHSFFPSKKGRTLKVLCEDEDGRLLELLCFNRPFLENMLSLGSSWYINAAVQRNPNGLFQTSAFELKRTREEAGIGKILPIYPLSGSLSQKNIRESVKYALKELSPFPLSMPYYLYEKYGFISDEDALKAIHFPENFEVLEKAKRTLAFSELLRLELRLLRDKDFRKRRKSQISDLEEKLISSLPFSLTLDQKKAADEIREDLDSKEPMERLLQGDVGSGKTLVAWISALHAIAKGGQVAFMAPTELLARQHAELAARLLEPLGINTALVIGDINSRARKLLLGAIERGDVNLAIGTHALFSGDVRFRNLRYVIIDEQHRFGVAQREALKNKGERPDVLSMTATPIPRTLALTLYASLDISTIKTMPNGRRPIITHLVSNEKRMDMYKAVNTEFSRGHQAYFVYPRINDEGDSDLRDVTTMYEELKRIYPSVPSALIHSKLPEEDKIRILSDFRDKKIMYLVATSVVEVGIDIPDATCMIIEHADRFGLAALHQLRGRVGRSSLQSYCFLVFDVKHYTKEAGERLKVMRDVTDGFIIAEKDLEIRGPGDIAGTEQAGFYKIHFASLTDHTELLEKASAEAVEILKEDRGLIKAENAMLREALS